MAGNGITRFIEGLLGARGIKTLTRLLWMKYLLLSANELDTVPDTVLQRNEGKNCLYVNGHEPGAELPLSYR